MTISNKVIVTFWLDSGCSQEDGEVSIAWQPVNFAIYDRLFVDLIYEAADEWLSENTLKSEVPYEVLFKHVMEHDGAGACHSEYFSPISEESNR